VLPGHPDCIVPDGECTRYAQRRLRFGQRAPRRQIRLLFLPWSQTSGEMAGKGGEVRRGFGAG